MIFWLFSSVGSSPDVMNKIKKACQELSSASSVFYIKDCNILLKNRDSERGEKETCDDLVMKMESRQEKSSDQQGHSKGRGKQKSGKMLSFTNTRKIEVCPFSIFHFSKRRVGKYIYIYIYKVPA